MEVGIIGLGKLGYTLAGVLGNHYSTVGYDIRENPEVPPEPGLEELLKTADLKVTNNPKDLRGADIIHCIVPTPSTDAGVFTSKYIRQAIKKVPLEDTKIFNVVSTVMPGTCDRLKKLLPKGVQITYNPEFIAIGNIVKGMTNPDFVLIGEDYKPAGEILEYMYSHITDAPVKRMGLKEAELTKLALNTYITQKITYANIIGEIAERMGIDGYKVLDAIGTDSRVGNKYLKPLGAFGGPCFPRDTIAFSRMAGDIPNFADLIDKINKRVAKNKGYADKRPQYQNVLGEGTGYE